MSTEQSQRITQLEELVSRLTESLRWMVANDETNEGDVPMAEYGGKTWDEVNSYWLEGKKEAIAALEASDILVPSTSATAPTP